MVKHEKHILLRFFFHVLLRGFEKLYPTAPDVVIGEHIDFVLAMKDIYGRAVEVFFKRPASDFDHH